MSLPSTGLSMSQVCRYTGCYTSSLAKLCGDNPNINMYSRWKPTRSSETTLSEEKIKVANCSLQLPQGTAVAAMNNAATAQWIYLPPTGTTASPYRLGDFRSYSKDAEFQYTTNVNVSRGISGYSNPTLDVELFQGTDGYSVHYRDMSQTAGGEFKLLVREQGYTGNPDILDPNTEGPVVAWPVEVLTNYGEWMEENLEEGTYELALAVQQMDGMYSVVPNSYSSVTLETITPEQYLGLYGYGEFIIDREQYTSGDLKMYTRYFLQNTNDFAVSAEYEVNIFSNYGIERTFTGTTTIQPNEQVLLPIGDSTTYRDYGEGDQIYYVLSNVLEDGETGTYSIEATRDSSAIKITERGNFEIN